MARNYRFTDWYWAVNGTPNQVYSSAAVSYVPVTDPTYVQWAVGGPPTPIPTEQALWDVLSALGMPIPATASVSDAEKDRQLSKADAVIFKVLFNQENRLRALEAKPAVTVAQFKAAVKALL